MMEIAIWATFIVAGVIASYCIYRIAEWYWRGRPYKWDQKEEHDDEH